MSRNFPTAYGNITNKQMKFIRNVVATNFDPDRLATSVVLAGYKPQTAKRTASMLMSHGAVRKVLLDCLEKSGITLETLTATHAEALGAMSQKNEKMPDHNVRLRAVQMGYDLWDALPSKKVQVGGSLSHQHSLDEKTLRRAEEVTGEEVVDAQILEESDLERPF